MATQTKPFCFYIIYTPGTVVRLRFLLHSLLTWCDCTFCLVVNGCTATEERALQDLCRTNQRLSFLKLPGRNMQPHGLALNRLQSLCRADYFCFMDSDIYATGGFLPAFTQHMPRYAGIFSGAPVWSTPETQVAPTDGNVMAGRHHYSQNGVCLGSTYFAIYDNQVLTKMRAATGVGFEGYTWQRIPARYQAQLLATDLKYQRYETGKLLNLLLHEQGYRLIYQPSDQLHHIGGLSRLAVDQQRSVISRLKTLAKSLLKGRVGKPVAKSFGLTEDYFAHLLLALHNNQPLPAPPRSPDRTLATKIQQMTHELTKLLACANRAGFAATTSLAGTAIRPPFYGRYLPR